MEFLQGFDDEEVQGKPDGTAPVGVAAELPGFRFGWRVAHRLIHMPHFQLKRVLEMPFRQRPHAVIGKKLGLIQHALQHLLHAMAAQ